MHRDASQRATPDTRLVLVIRPDASDNVQRILNRASSVYLGIGYPTPNGSKRQRASSPRLTIRSIMALNIEIPYRSRNALAEPGT